MADCAFCYKPTVVSIPLCRMTSQVNKPKLELPLVTSHVNKPNFPLPPLTTRQYGARSSPNFNLLLFTNLTLPTLLKAFRRSRDGGRVNDLPCKPKFELLLSHGVNSPRPCEVNKQVDSMTPCLT
jgi:hypothetical protein